MKDQISDLKAKLFQFQLWMERHPVFHITITVIYGITAIVLIIFCNLINLNPEVKIVASIMFIMLFMVIIVIDTIHVTIIKDQRFEMEQRKRLISELVSVERNVYRVKFRHEIFDIEPDGDAIYTRAMILEYDNVDVAWAEMLFGVTNEYGSDFERMILKAYSYPDSKFTLSRVPIEATKSRMRFAIILRNKITSTHRTEGFLLTMKWLRAWKALMINNADDGMLRTEYDTSECILELRFPHGYSYVDFRMPRTSGALTEGQLDDGRHYIKYRLVDLPKGEAFAYFVEIKKD